MRALSFLILLGGCASAPRAELVAVPGTDLRIEMVYVPGTGKIRPFWISTREITWREFDRFYQSPDEQRVDGVTRPSSGKNYLQLSGVPAEAMEEGKPVTNLRFHSAISFCEWLSRKSGMIFRLPTEAEWEASPGHPRIWQYCLEPDRPPDFGPILRGETRRTIPPDWDDADPNRPVSTWWFRTGNIQGFRVVRIPGDTSAASTIRISGLKGEERDVRVGRSVSLYMRVTGEVQNTGSRAIEELLLKVYFLDPAGKPHFEDVTSNLTRRATFNICAPALRNSAHAGDHANPLAPGESRTFTVDLPMSFDADADVQMEKFGAAVVHVRFAD